MNTVVRLALRNTLRRKTRTLLTMGMVVVAVALLLLALTWVHGIFGSMTATAANMAGHVRIVTRGFAAREELMPLYENLPEVETLAAKLRAASGVQAVEPRIMSGVTLSAGEEIGDVFGLAVGAHESYFRDRTDAKAKLTQGAWFSGAPGEVVAGAKVVEQAKAKIGDELILLTTTQDGSISSVKATLVGVFRTGSAFDQQLFLPLSELQYLSDLEGGATELLVYSASFEDASALARRLRTLPELASHDVMSFEEREPWRSLSGTVQAMENIIVFVIVFLAALGIWNTMTMSVLERTHEIGVLRALGLSRLGTLGLFVGEGLLIGGLGGLLGLAVGAYPAYLLESVGITIGERAAQNMPIGLTERVYGDLSPEGLLTALTLGLLMALLGSALPALRAASIRPVSAMRSGR